MEKLKIALPVIVEGRYDKARLASVIDAHIITTEGFGIFRENEKKALLRRLAGERGVIVLTDSDGAGLVIRGYLCRILPKDKVYNIYVPALEGKERRKAQPSKEGLIGVEGMDCEILRGLFEHFAGEGACGEADDELTKAEFYADGYSGKTDSSERRLALAGYLALPRNLSSNAMIEAINLLGLRDKYETFTEQLNKNGEET